MTKIITEVYIHGKWIREDLVDSIINADLSDSQRAQLLILYKEKLQSLGDEAFFDYFDSIRRECYFELGLDIEEMERSSAAAQLGKQGGKSTSESKSSAARENGKRGGRKKGVTVDQLSLEDI